MLEDSYMAVKKKAVKKTAKKAVKKTAAKTAKKVAKKTAKKSTPKTAKKITKKADKKTAKKAAKKTVKKVAKKAASKTETEKKAVTKKSVAVKNTTKQPTKKTTLTNVVESTIKPIEQNEFINLKLHKAVHDDPRLHAHEEQKVIEEVKHPPLEPITREEPKIGRNDPCPCGSGLKYKKCCGK